MIWAALSIGLTVLLAVWSVRPQARACALGSPSRWLVLPDEPRPVPALALPAVIPVRSSLPAVIVTHAAWSAPSQGWRAEKPLTPWFRSMAPYAAVAAFGAVSLDLSALGLGVTEIAPPSLLDGQSAPHETAGAGFGLNADLSALFGESHDTAFVLDSAAWDQSDFAVPAWQRPPEPSHDWWA
jgi:hypothetical protein